MQTRPYNLQFRNLSINHSVSGWRQSLLCWCLGARVERGSTVLAVSRLVTVSPAVTRGRCTPPCLSAVTATRAWSWWRCMTMPSSCTTDRSLTPCSPDRPRTTFCSSWGTAIRCSASTTDQVCLQWIVFYYSRQQKNTLHSQLFIGFTWQVLQERVQQSTLPFASIVYTLLVKLWQLLQ